MASSTRMGASLRPGGHRTSLVTYQAQRFRASYLMGRFSQLYLLCGRLCVVGSGRYLLGDTLGQLFLVVLNYDDKEVQSLHLEVPHHDPQKESHDGTVGRDVRSLSSSCWGRCVWQVLGETSCARTMSYLDKGMVFVGSSFGDSQVVRLQAERDESGSYVKVSRTP